MKIRKQIPVFAAVALGAFVGFGAGTLLYEKGVEDGGAGKREAITARRPAGVIPERALEPSIAPPSRETHPK